MCIYLHISHKQPINTCMHIYIYISIYMYGNTICETHIKDYPTSIMHHSETISIVSSTHHSRCFFCVWAREGAFRVLEFKGLRPTH